MSKIPGISGIKKPTPAVNGVSEQQNGTSAQEEKKAVEKAGPSASEVEDPIGECVDAREKAGGLGNQMTEADAKKKNIPLYRAIKHSTMVKGGVQVDFTESASNKENTPSNRSAKTAASSTKSTPARPATGIKRPTTAASQSMGAADIAIAREDLGGVDDPIAQSIQDRVKAGGLTATVKEADAKKQGLQIPKVAAHKVKASNALQDFVDPTGASPDPKSAKSGIGAGSGSPNKRNIQSAAGVRQSKDQGFGGIKPRPAGQVPAECQLDGDLSEDPIAQSVSSRLAAGGLGDTITAADAKKKNYPVFAAPKHVVKGTAPTIDLGAPPVAASPQKGLKTPTPSTGAKAGGLKPPTKVGAGVKPSPRTESKKQEAAIPASEDPIGAACQIRKDLGGLANQMIEADAKKKKVYVPVPLKLKTGKEVTVDFIGDSPAADKADNKPKLTGLQKPTAVPKAGAKQASSRNLGQKQEPVDESDPLDVALAARKAAGAADTVIIGMDAKKKKLQIPRPLNLKIADPKSTTLTFISAEAIEEEKKTNAAKEDKKPSKMNYEMDPIDYSTQKRKQAGGADTLIQKAEAQKQQITTSPNLDLKVPSGVLVDFEPQAVATDSEPPGFTKQAASIESGNTEEEKRESQEQYVELMKQKEEQEKAEKEAEEQRVKLEREQAALEEQERLKQEQAEKEAKAAQQKTEAEAELAGLEKEKANQEETERLKQEQEAQRIAQEKAEKETEEDRLRLEKEKAELEEQEKSKREEEEKRLAAEQAEREAEDERVRLEREQTELEQQEEERLRKEEEDLRLAEEEAERENERIRLELEKEAAELAEQDRIKKEKEASELEAQLLAEHAQPEEDEEDDGNQSEEKPDDQPRPQENSELAGLMGELDGGIQDNAANNIIDHPDSDQEINNAAPETMEEAKHHEVEEPVEDKPTQEVIAPPQSIEKNEVDGEFIKQIWPYLRLGAAMPDEKELNDKQFCYEMGLEIRQDLEDAIAKNNDNINGIMKAHPNAADPKELTPFELSEIAKDGIDIVKDIQIEYEDWIETSVDSEWTIRTLKLWFFMLRGFADKNAWVQWPQIFNDKAFMTKACETIEGEVAELHVYLTSKSKEFVFDDLEHMARMECLVQHLGGTSQVDPSAEACDSSVSTFVMFVLRDALEFSGLLPDKKRVPHRELQLCHWKRDMYQKNLSKLNDALD